MIHYRRLTTIFLTAFLAYITSSTSSRILAIHPVPLKSFFFYNEAILKALHSAGHDITFVSPFPDHESIENYTCIDSKKDELVYVGQTDVDHFSSMSTRKFAKMMIDLEDKYCNEVAELPVIQEALSGLKSYDVVFIGMIQMYECYFSLANKLGVPVIGTINYRSWMSERGIGNPFNPAVVPIVWSSHGKIMNFYQRLVNVWNVFMNDFLYFFVVSPKLTAFNERHFPNLKPSRKQPALIFINSHLALQPRPMVPNAVEIGGIHIQPKKRLSKNLEKFIEEAEHGVVVFSFGSVMKTSTLPKEVLNVFVEAFAELPQRVIWKFDDKIPRLSANVLTSEWIPQRDILEHPNVKAFISHCGLAGVYEAIYSGTPIVASPFFCDQRSNTALLTDLGVALELDLKNLTKERVLHTLNSIINDTRYLEKMLRLSHIFRDRPVSAQQSVIYWTEYVIKYGGAEHLRTTAADMPLYQYLLLDIIGLVMLATLIFGWIACFIVKMAMAHLRKEPVEKPKEKVS